MGGIYRYLRARLITTTRNQVDSGRDQTARHKLCNAQHLGKRVVFSINTKFLSERFIVDEQQQQHILSRSTQIYLEYDICV